jgi:hypothetical protein
VIRQAISCDICGAEKKQTNHWFVTSEQGGELRVSGWSSRNRLRAGSKHLCGQTCLHKLVDEFMASLVAGRKSQPAADIALLDEPLPDIDTTLTSNAAYLEPQPVVRPVNKPAAPVPPGPVFAAPAVIVPFAAPTIVVPASVAPIETQVWTSVNGPLPRPAAPPVEDAPNYASRRWRAEAWERERERELHAVEHHAESSPRRRKAF